MNQEIREFEVYRVTIVYLVTQGWRIICASPPGGTDVRFRKCLLPRREIGGSDKGHRDEVDITADKGSHLLLIECKPTLVESLTTQNALGESDLVKLCRIRDSLSPNELARLIGRGTGMQVFENPTIWIGLAVGAVDTQIPEGVKIIKVNEAEAVPLGDWDN